MNVFHRVSRLLVVATVVFVGNASAFTEYITEPMVATYKYAVDTRPALYAAGWRDSAKQYIIHPHATGLIAYVMQDAVSSNVHVKDLFVAAGDSALEFLNKLANDKVVADITRHGLVPTVAGVAARTIGDIAKKFAYISAVRKAQEMMKEVASPAEFVAKQYNDTVPAFPGKKQVGEVVSAVYNKVTNPQVLVLGGMDVHNNITRK